MRSRASIATLTTATALLTAIWAGAGCTHASGKLMVDAPKLMAFQAPDIDDITGIDSDQPDESTSAGSGSAQTPPK
jgi:hypothetical protein